MSVRVHNSIVMQMRLAGMGNDVDFKGVDAGEINNQDPHDDATIRKLAHLTDRYLAKERAKYG